MTVQSLLQLGGEEEFHQYKVRFDSLYLSGPITDVLNRTVEFSDESCGHVCYEQPRGLKWSDAPRDVWRQDCAERIEWITHALTTPYEVRPGNRADYDVYLISWEVMTPRGRKRDRFMVAVEVKSATLVRFVTAYTADLDSWDKARRIGPCRHSPPKPKKPQK